MTIYKVAESAWVAHMKALMSTNITIRFQKGVIHIFDAKIFRESHFQQLSVTDCSAVQEPSCN